MDYALIELSMKGFVLRQHDTETLEFSRALLYIAGCLCRATVASSWLSSLALQKASSSKHFLFS